MTEGSGVTLRLEVRGFVGILLRDLQVLRNSLWEFIGQSVLQPFFFIFVFTYVFPKIQGGVISPESAGAFATTVIPGLMALTALFEALYTVGMPMSVDLGLSREIEDRLGAPLPTVALSSEKVMLGAIHAIFAGLLVVPIAYLIPVQHANFSLNNWAVTILSVCSVGVLAASLALVLGTLVKPERLGVIFTLVLIPVGFLGCTYYSWVSLSSIRWLQVLVLVNPLTFMSESLRAGLTANAAHMNTVAAIGGTILYASILLIIGIRAFNRRVIS